jgi:hypothetical protein
MRVIPATTSALLRHLAAGLIVIGSVISCANLLLAPAEQLPCAPPLTPDAPLTPDEERAWADLVARLVPHA